MFARMAALERSLLTSRKSEAKRIGSGREKNRRRGVLGCGKEARPILVMGLHPDLSVENM